MHAYAARRRGTLKREPLCERTHYYVHIPFAGGVLPKIFVQDLVIPEDLTSL
jgi:hypothetical protein